MTKKSFVFSLVLAIAFLVVANVQADVVTSLTEAQKGMPELFQVHVYGNGGNLTANKSDKYEDSDFTVRATTKSTGTTDEALIKLYFNEFDVETFPDYDYFSWTKGQGAGIVDLHVNGGEAIYDGNLWEGYPGQDILYFTGYENDEEFVIDFISGGRKTNGEAPENMYYDFYITFYGSGSEGDGPVVPEPATLAVLGLGLVGLGTVARRRRK